MAVRVGSAELQSLVGFDGSVVSWPAAWPFAAAIVDLPEPVAVPEHAVAVAACEAFVAAASSVLAAVFAEVPERWRHCFELIAEAAECSCPGSEQEGTPSTVLAPSSVIGVDA